ncbi:MULTISPECIES: hypothetical protein [unclassified Colwellia]|uniref:hypothetical protein n=1 Tax=unclassified Colwellia TaxID=196834 RepID=UPI0015F504F8|nr:MULTISPECIES: hypothetical protein [unclassified Colwellia]MBA6225333.1 hypothetical protein [Colwellia sp. MB3u-45]MBA6267217.1 hypothetical protein [Colwellia sp. MB3u-43]MBA6289963.1 hypothetical protein [Colwellia sp. MB3u-4]MBA6297153.1 hypothetical protein [Colwellia sp. MB02u-9]MBA6322829.1 hypothetical protein [Colwellia sp. MB02u-19]
MTSILNEDWVAPTIVIIAFVILIGNLSTFQKSAKTPLRKKGLNDLKETVPRTQKSPHKMATVSKTNDITHKIKNSD